MIGYSVAAGMVVTVILLPKGRGEWWGVNAWRANGTDEGTYREGTVMSEVDPETARLIEEEAEHAETTRDEPYPPGVVAERRNRARSSVYSIRLAEDEIAEVQRLAASAGVPASTLVRSWIMQRLNETRAGEGSIDPAVRAAIHAEVREAVREVLAETDRRSA